jgi:hypothetical protein
MSGSAVGDHGTSLMTDRSGNRAFAETVTIPPRTASPSPMTHVRGLDAHRAGVGALFDKMERVVRSCRRQRMMPIPIRSRFVDRL